jgi:glycosyltransferase involved in cell wall biosynthesis
MVSSLEEFEHNRYYLSNARKPWRAAPSLTLGLLGMRRAARQADLLHIVGDTSVVLCAPLFARCRTVWSTQGLHLLRRSRGIQAKVVQRRLVSAINTTQQTICSSRSEVEELRQLGGVNVAAKLVEVPNGIPLPTIPTREERKSARRRLNLADDSVVALYLGQLESRKRPFDAIVAARRAAAKGANIVLLIAGAGPLAGDVAAESGETVRALGFQSDPSSLLAAADIFLMPSEREGLALAMLEAMGYGLAIIASDGPGNPEALGDAGVVHRVGDVDALTSSLVSLVGSQHERERLGVAARTRAEANFTVERFLDDMRGVINAVVSS